MNKWQAIARRRTQVCQITEPGSAQKLLQKHTNHLSSDPVSNQSDNSCASLIHDSPWNHTIRSKYANGSADCDLNTRWNDLIPMKIQERIPEARTKLHKNPRYSRPFTGSFFNAIDTLSQWTQIRHQTYKGKLIAESDKPQCVNEFKLMNLYQENGRS